MVLIMDYQSLMTNALAVAERDPASADDLVTVTHVHHSDRTTTAVAVIRPGGGLRPHFHRDHDEIIVFLRGEATFRIGEETRRVRANDVISVPAGVVHATVHAETEVVLAAVFAPRFDPVNEDRIYVDT